MSAPPRLLASPTAPSVPGDLASEVLLAPPSSLPIFGPRYAPVTIDLYLPIGHRATAQNLELARRLTRESQDVRLLFHPVLGSEPAERGAEAIFAAWRQQPTTARCFALAEALASHPEWLTAAPAPEPESALLEAARGLGLDAELLARDLRRHSQRPGLIATWQRERAEVRSPPEVWINGRRLRGPLSEAMLRDELERQRSRAYQQLRAGVPLTRLYEQLLVKERGEPSPPWSGRFGTPLSAAPLPLASLSPRPPQLATANPTAPHLELAGSPLRGPKVAPATLVIIGSLDTYSTYLATHHVSEAWQRHRDAVQLVFQHAPTTDNGRRVALLLVQLGRTDPAAFWQVFDGILELMQRRFLLRYADIVDLLRRQRIDVAKLEATLHDPVLSDAAKVQLNRDYQQAQRLGLPYLPLILLNGRPLQNVQSTDRIDRLIEAELRRGVLARWLGTSR